MIFYLIAADYKTASLEARERLYRRKAAIAEFWETLSPQQAAMLITCNRIEIYAFAPDSGEARGNIRRFLGRFPEFNGNSSVFLGYTAIFTHAVRLAAGLESQLQGEPQILGQLETWLDKGLFATPLREMIAAAIAKGRDIRRRCGLSGATGSLAAMVYGDIARRLGNAGHHEIVILGTGKVAELFAASRPGNARLTFASHRNFSRAAALARRSEGNAIPLEEIARAASAADVLVGATASPHAVLGARAVAGFVASRAKALHIYDLSVPRSVDPCCASLPGVVLENLDTLRGLFAEENARVSENVRLAGYLCAEEDRQGERIYE